jgi:hypothetical protein
MSFKLRFKTIQKSMQNHSTASNHSKIIAKPLCRIKIDTAGMLF